MDEQRHKMVDKLMSDISYLEIKEKITATLNELRSLGTNNEVLITFIDRSISQLNNIGWLQDDVNVKLKIRYSKSQLELIKRRIAEQY